MNNKEIKLLLKGCGLIVTFITWTYLIQTVDVKAIGLNGTNIGFATLNTNFHKLIGVHMNLYIITDWMGLVPLLICVIFGMMGLKQLITRKSIFKVDYDIILLGIYYLVVVFVYLIFEEYPINYRPILIDGFMEASYPSSTTLLVLSVMPTLNFQSKRRISNIKIAKIICICSNIFSLFMVIGRMISGVHWFTDIIGSLLFSIGLFYIYKSCVILIQRIN